MRNMSSGNSITGIAQISVVGKASKAFSDAIKGKKRKNLLMARPCPSNGNVLLGAIYLSQLTSLGSVRSLMPVKTWEIRSLDKVPIFSDKSLLFTVKIWEIFTTLFLDKLASPLLKVTLPGALDLLRFDVNVQTTTVLIRLRLKRLF